MLLVVFILACAPEGRVRKAPTDTDAVGDSKAGDSEPDSDFESDSYFDTSVLPVTRFAIIGDYGTGGSSEAEVAQLVDSWGVDFIITLGDNNYSVGSATTIDLNIGRDWHPWIHPYSGSYGTGASENKFWPSPGNHDWGLGNLDAYLDFFELPGNERYYDKRINDDVHLFSLDSDSHEPDGKESDGVQGAWAEAGLAASDAPWKFVYMHHPPYSSGVHGNRSEAQWPYKSWGASMVFSGHDHNYERIRVDDFVYLVQGMGGAGLRDMHDAVEGSELSYNEEHGATLVVLHAEWAKFTTIGVDGVIADQYATTPDGDGDIDSVFISEGSEWRYLDTGVAPAVDWTLTNFDDGAWASGSAPLGYGDTVSTEVGYGSDSDDKHATTWFRHSFDVVDASQVDALLMAAQHDDGVIVYLNGEEIWRVGFPATNVDPDDYADITRAGDWEDRFARTQVRPELLQDGVNVLSAEVHQRSAGSSDLRWEASLRWK
jgi:tartrate-resistant acid phosphatase type 5